ncbi:MAG TPA: OB-fold domain-containing protein [Burkholderiales bacterium]|nr:OB-fold domain-containing protein [Burkholderiales bacterium]
MTVLDWTSGEEGIAYQRCGGCASVWYFQRGFCPVCGHADVQTLQASGRGTVHAMSLVHRAPNEELRAHAPYLIVLIDMDEGFRLMAHGAKGLAIGDRVRARFVAFGSNKSNPFFERSTN